MSQCGPHQIIFIATCPNMSPILIIMQRKCRVVHRLTKKVVHLESKTMGFEINSKSSDILYNTVPSFL